MSKTRIQFEQVYFKPRTFICMGVWSILAAVILLTQAPKYYQNVTWFEFLFLGALFVGSNAFMVYQALITPELGFDDKPITPWSIVHFWSGCFLGVLVPFSWMQVLNFSYELLEQIVQYLENHEIEIVENRIGDLIFVTFGWCCTRLYINATR